jgi:2-oxoisovalerate dehydrogenase E2 component (dihydrolipoyl transacylase)
VPVIGGIETHRMLSLSLSLTFDHRACTGGEAARFLKVMLDDLARAA